MGHDINEDQLVHYFAGELTDEEVEAVETWIQEDPRHRKRAEALRKIWDAAQKPSSSSRDRNVDTLWNQLSDRMEESLERQPDPPQTRTRIRSSRIGSKRRFRHWSASRWRRSDGRLFRVAAAAALLLVGAAVFFALRGAGFTPLSRSSEGTAMREIATEAGQRVRVRLGDSTQVILNARSTLRLPPDGFASDVRKVHLQGEAYFNVTSDAERPFVVHTEEASTHVLGTAFDVSAYSEDEVMQVTVAKGKVAVRSEEREDEAEHEVVLTARQTGRLAKQGAPVVQSGVDVTPYLAWTEGRLVFKDASLGEVARKLERWYDLQVQLEGTAEAEVDRLNAAFENEPVNEVLSLIANTLGLRFEHDGGVVTFAPDASLSARL